ncbi:Uroporphyrinogen decarboxylase [Sporotomaculum syntrophicum]|uniref:Uroporphyrinogen decarboxylase n=1 Tax=Sporotomaculum syntrophicum TaxID=182264 RepID=A0A9D2WSD4_9FIRM|nr:MtaA/CmuA family methyltransferase [Sporotomaculum syntrophicum]KAF1086700.1 Uroporphyrinogen decarboxylase [Sporotomaculum syntrophicum]
MSAYTPKERLLAVVHKQPVDKPPCICPGGMMNMVFQEIMEKSNYLWPEAHVDPEKMAGLAYALNEAGGFENYGVPFCMTVEAEAMGAKVNMGNLLSEPHVVESPLASSTRVDLLQPLDINSGRVKVVIEAIKLLKAKNTGVPIIGNLTGPVSIAGTLVDMSVLLKEYLKSPAQAEKLMEFIVANLIAFGQAQIEAGADAICISEPSGTGEILGPQRFRAFSVRYVNNVLDALEVPVKIVHICGALKSVYEIIQEFHCDVFSFDSIVPVQVIKQYIPDIIVMGNISTHALGTMSPDKVTSLVKSAMSKGADIIAPACGLSTTTPLINVQTMVAATKEKTTVN